MQFRTKVPIEKQSLHLIDYTSKLFLVGSCFSDSIGGKFSNSEFITTSNPLGVLFHPIAIEQFITRAINEELYTKDELFYQNELYCSLEAHSQFNSTNSNDILASLNKALSETKSALEEATHVFITLGTSWVYRHIATDNIVANCHKIPQKQFLKELLSVERIKNSLEAIVSLISHSNPKAVFVLTVSPVRHLKDGFVENNRSKAHLISAVQEVVEDSKRCFYFPSYEIMMDELRDYRFFSKDMLHPSEQAIEYIWDKVKEVWLSNEANVLQKQVKSYKQGLNHKPFTPDSATYKKFKIELEQKRIELSKRIPYFK